ncbi:type II toxin-antitoxin system mRNA interferase toxin, RelE/StbE family [Corynebacterium hindlerae]|uniref:Type II toxin-antitoxin system mRNA interferase toxin, RelE/StbE family n=1 Tax=Corynebacterium hindlerae TaxID=699041 RepID=A0A7G5FF91_9CORY|nr:type II toxin-antitoxin system mRNA interferase toxin, RelE/StbE family [Corynebacterium hindlerae]QMV85282.1 type II toxin-antitoxin system mRNA interferase toxin, RelE/StbE family [Corynebacterium hindlerae]QTH58835.1 type II toxin-antitoxin system mRNA interferase toxin, RelE/StbE family [Corynebacterium hindlerae]
MIVSFQHRGLEEYFKTGSKRGIQPQHANKLSRVLSVLDQATTIEPILRIPGYRAHELVGDRKGFWSVRITGNWRVIFRFVGEDVELVDYLDYH